MKNFGNPLISSEKTCAVMEQSESIVKSADLLNIQRPLQTDEQAQGNLLYNHKERVQVLSNEEQLIKLFTDEGFCPEFHGHVQCREYTLPRDDESTTPRRWIPGNTKTGLV